MQTTHEFVLYMSKDVERTEEFIDKTITVDKMLPSDAKNVDVVNLSGSCGTNSRDVRNSPFNDLNDRDHFEMENKFIKFFCEDDSLGFLSLFKRSQDVNVSKSMDIEGKLKREGSCSQVSIDYLLPCKLLQLGLYHITTLSHGLLQWAFNKCYVAL